VFARKSFRDDVKNNHAWIFAVSSAASRLINKVVMVCGELIDWPKSGSHRAILVGLDLL
jgi:hypothetical protein